jgi:hypothetical protein
VTLIEDALAAAPRAPRPPLRTRLAAAATAGGRRGRELVTAARTWRLTLALPALAGAGLISAAAAMVYLPAGLAVAGVFCLRLDARL